MSGTMDDFAGIIDSSMRMIAELQEMLSSSMGIEEQLINEKYANQNLMALLASLAEAGNVQGIRMLEASVVADLARFVESDPIRLALKQIHDVLDTIDGADEVVLDTNAPDAVRAARLVRLLDNADIRYWMSEAYEGQPPDNKLRGVVAEILTAELLEKNARENSAADGLTRQVLVGLKVSQPDAERLSGWRDLAELDNLVVVKEDGLYVPETMAEAKAGKVAKGTLKTQLSKKIKSLERVGTEEIVIRQGDVDLTPLFAPGAFTSRVQTLGASAHPNADIAINSAEVNSLCEDLRPLFD
ncbi:MAG: hypothetical protein AAFV53_22535 [Myxococcota bacterium]